MPEQMFNRFADNWRSLLAIADAAGEGWSARGRRAAQSAGVAAGDDDQSLNVLLLADIRDIFTVQKADRLPSERLVEAFVKIEDRPWAEWGKKRKSLTKNGLGRLLKPFCIAPDRIRTGDHTPRGYQRHLFEDAFARYLPPLGK